MANAPISSDQAIKQAEQAIQQVLAKLETVTGHHVMSLNLQTTESASTPAVVLRVTIETAPPPRARIWEFS